jgi:hypothetical protein
MENPIEEMFNDDRFDEDLHPDLTIRYSIFLLHREHWDFMQFVVGRIEEAPIREAIKERLNQWLRLMAADHYDFMMRQPESFLEIYDDFCREV